MKPLLLKISGLHSFREEQEIPFAQLSELGVFGIFGPTGSGKSSILDAMTLALYGTVVRAGRRTQGILNHAEKQVKVSLMFSLGQGDAYRIYRAERRYTRKDQLAVTNTHSRLVAVAGEHEEILADKDRDVTDKVTQLLGLREEDFTRAVVLPQGKFAEFLNLGGKERREMLQRLFSLEQYGNVLLNKVNDRYKITEVSYIEMESEQKGIGDASPARVKEAAAVLTAARQAEAAALHQYKETERLYNETKEIHGLQNELNKKQLELAAHRQREPEIKSLGIALEQAEKAARVLPVLDEFIASQTAQQAAADTKQQTAELAKKTAEESGRQTSMYMAAQQARLKLEPELIERRTKLDAAVTLEKEVTRLAQETMSLGRQQQQQQANCRTASQAVTQQAAKNEALAATIKELEQQQLAVAISAAMRKQAQLCQQAAHTLEQRREAAGKVKQQGVLRKQHLTAAEAAASQAREKLSQAEQRLQELELAEVQAAQKQLAAATAQLDQLIAGEKQTAAARLAGELVPGQACPVCGSTSHPRPVGVRAHATTAAEQNFEQDIMAAKAHIAKLTQALAETGKAVAAERENLNKIRTAAAALEQQAATALSELNLIREDYVEAREAVAAALAQLSSALQEAGQETSAGMAAETALGQMQAINEYIVSQDRQYESIAKQLAGYRQQYEINQAKIPELQRSVQTAEADLAALTARLASLNELEKAKSQELRAITGGIPANQLLSRTQQELETIRREESMAQERAEKAANAASEAEQACARADTSWQEAAKRREALSGRFEAKLAEEGLGDTEAVRKAHIPAARQEEYRRILKEYAAGEQRLTAQCEQLAGALNGRCVTDAAWEQLVQRKLADETAKNKAAEQRIEADKEYRDIEARHLRWSQLESSRLELKDKKDCLLALRTVLRGNVFVEYLAQEQMDLVARQASERLKQITQHRYALEMSSDGGFLIRDDANGGVRRPVSTLSGGETFQASLALALALSAQIQLRGKYPLEFFFLDEGFGSLDQYALDVAMSSLEKLHLERLTIGVISHVSELRQRMPRRLVVEPAQPAGRGSYVRLEEA
ncbi:AAA family ATPase [Sporomusa aerivorans]|uniref:AAA family ATPase n=1 Tax=Sporomusa aerivorans TaxID=204936 RepID=UPI00352B6DA4